MDMTVDPQIGDSQSDAVLQTWLQARHSCRAFLPDAVPRATVERILTLAQRTASWCNSQPWRLHITEAGATQRLRLALLERATAGGTFTPDFPFPEEYRDVYLERRREAGFQLYNAMGVPRGDREAYRQQSLRNFDFFGAPHLALITSDRSLGDYGAIDCGGYVSTFLLAAQANGVATVPQAALAMYPEVLREQLNIADDRLVVCAISFGFEDEEHPANSYRTNRASLAETVTWVSE